MRETLRKKDILTIARIRGYTDWSKSMHDKILQSLGLRADDRNSIVVRMMHRDHAEAAGYWLQLVVSVGIATLGLVVGSTAVVIGAMLVAPLMGPIVGLAMGLSAGSPFLVLRSAGRIALSVLVAVAGATLITVLSPFHELNAEISSRVTPTVLDLITAAFCALAGVYATLRPGSDTTTTAAGTSISISLVPPLCASGYGLGTDSSRIASGAALLFLTNLVAIVVVGTVAFVSTGFHHVDVVELESKELARDDGAPLARALARRLAGLFASRAGPALRLLMPVVLLAILYIPLRKALDEVAWEVRVRAAVRASIAREPRRVVQSKVHIERHAIEVVLAILGTVADADKARIRIEADLQHASGVQPHIDVLAIPDAAAFAGLESTLLKPHPSEIAAAPAPSPMEQWQSVQGHVRSTVERLWPSGAAGTLSRIDLGLAEQTTLRMRLVHLGEPLHPDGVEALQRAVASALDQQVVVVDVPVTPRELTASADELAFVASAAALISAAAELPGSTLCVTNPTTVAKPQSRRRDDDELSRMLGALLARHPQVVTHPGEEHSLRVVLGQCAFPASLDGGQADTDASSADVRD